MGKLPHLVLFLWLSCVTGCMLDRSGLRSDVWLDSGDSGDPVDASSSDADVDAGFDAGIADADVVTDAGIDASVNDSGVDSGMDAGFDGGMPDSGTDAGFDGGMPDAGPPRRLELRFERFAVGTAVQSFWAREASSGAWRQICDRTEVTNPSSRVYSCMHDVAPLPGGITFRFYAALNESGTNSVCNPDGPPTGPGCAAVGTHRAYLDGVEIALGEESPTMPYPPAGMNRAMIFATPP